MATRGRKPKPTHLHLVTGTHRADRHGDPAGEPAPAGRPVRPAWLRGRAAKLWDEHAAIGFWLTAADGMKLAVWCALGAELARGVKDVSSSRISQWRTLGAELGFDPSGRTRLGVVGTGIKGKDADDGADAKPKGKYFDD